MIIREQRRVLQNLLVLSFLK
ncbi:MAG: hypothetical protein LN590_05875 [Rickettsia endosymbiont of Glossina mortisans submortisans]|nr:hypothetical protein [Rickettsia endosymbiont of Glossina mortisans submortisans]